MGFVSTFSDYMEVIEAGVVCAFDGFLESFHVLLEGLMYVFLFLFIFGLAFAAS